VGARAKEFGKEVQERTKVVIFLFIEPMPERIQVSRQMHPTMLKLQKEKRQLQPGRGGLLHPGGNTPDLEVSIEMEQMWGFHSVMNLHRCSFLHSSHRINSHSLLK
jgi:hypothetical protein